MTTTIEYALFAGNSYRDTMGLVNRLPAPDGWQPLDDGLDYVPPDATGFEATAYKKTLPDGKLEIVISFAGTGPGSIFKQPDWWTNLLLYSGEAEGQLKAPAVYYERIKNDPAYAAQNIEQWCPGTGPGSDAVARARI